MTTERLHRTVFYYENTGHLIKYAGIVSILLKGVVALVVLVCTYFVELSLYSHCQTFTFVSFLDCQPSPKTSGFCPAYVGEKDHTVICLVCALADETRATPQLWNNI
jgi:hypothetical protein